MKKLLFTRYVPLCIIAILSILLGYFTGTLINGKFFTADKYGGITKEELVEDISSISYEGKTPDQLSATDAFIVALYKLHNQENYTRNSLGELQTSVGVKQFIHSKSGKVGDLHYQEVSAYSSMIKKAGKFTYEIGGNIHYQEGSPTGNSLNSVTWSEKFKDYTYDEYSNLLGRNPDYESTYIVSSKTAISSSECKKSDGLYTYTITLDPTLSTMSYIKEISFVSNIDGNTVDFTSVTMEFTLDHNFTLISQKNCETYTLKYSGIPVTINSVYNITFTY